MTLEDAQKVADIVAQADGGCSTCVGALIYDLNNAFPEFAWDFGDNPAYQAWIDDDDAPDDAQPAILRGIVGIRERQETGDQT